MHWRPAVWMGGLAALELTVTHRGQWARVLPRFSQLSLCAWGVLLIAGGRERRSSWTRPAELWATGYGRLLAAKVVVTVDLVGAGLAKPVAVAAAARAHRSSAALSQHRSLAELGMMACCGHPCRGSGRHGLDSPRRLA